MRKSLLFVIMIICGCLAFSGCIKHGTNNTINPSMSATIGAYTFSASSVVPSVVDTQTNDTSIALVITGNSSDIIYPWDKIVLTVNDYKGKTGTFSIVMSQASAYYLHSGVQEQAIGGIVSITQITSNSIIGYFSFNSPLVTVSNGTFNVGKPGAL